MEMHFISTALDCFLRVLGLSGWRAMAQTTHPESLRALASSQDPGTWVLSLDGSNPNIYLGLRFSFGARSVFFCKVLGNFALDSRKFSLVSRVAGPSHGSIWGLELPRTLCPLGSHWPHVVAELLKSVPCD